MSAAPDSLQRTPGTCSAALLPGVPLSLSASEQIKPALAGQLLGKNAVFCIRHLPTATERIHGVYKSLFTLSTLHTLYLIFGEELGCPKWTTEVDEFCKHWLWQTQYLEGLSDLEQTLTRSNSCLLMFQSGRLGYVFVPAQAFKADRPMTSRLLSPVPPQETEAQG